MHIYDITVCDDGMPYRVVRALFPHARGKMTSRYGVAISIQLTTISVLVDLLNPIQVTPQGPCRPTRLSQGCLEVGQGHEQDLPRSLGDMDTSSVMSNLVVANRFTVWLLHLLPLHFYPQ